MALCERCRRGAVADLLSEPRRSVGPRRVVNADSWFVAASPPGLVESPHQIHVLPEAETLVEPADVIEGRRADHDRRGGDVVDATPGSNASGFVAEIQRCGRVTDHARCDQPDSRVVEVGEERGEPAARRKRDVGIDEREQWSRGDRTSGVAGRTRASVLCQSHGCSDDRRIGAVVDGDVAVGAGGSVELGRDDGDVAAGRGAVGAGWSGVDGTRVEEAVDERGRGHVVA